MNYSLNQAKSDIISSIEKVLLELNYKCEIKLETPPSDNMGDFAFPCFLLAPIAKKTPAEIAKDISGRIEKTRWVEKIQAKGGKCLSLEELMEENPTGTKVTLIA